MCRKLALYFLSQGAGHSRILEADKAPTAKGWLVGRGTDADIVFSPSRNPDYSEVSKSHAYIAAAPTSTKADGNAGWRWTVVDWGVAGEGSKNGVWLRRGFGAYRIQPGVAVTLIEADHLHFGNAAASVKVSFDIDDTDSDEADNGPTTIASTKPIVMQPINPPQKPDSPWFVPSIFNPVWDWYSAKNSAEQFVFLLALGGIVALILYVWKM